ncbi:hypothetical protein FRC12_010990 [Ceratobasidium sp. 428]|nr:hypothetical protein FRC12_010990 [Ceratobasidium sp. 428]
MSRNPKASGSSSKPLVVRSSIYQADARQRKQSSGRKTSKAFSSTVTVPTRAGVVENLLKPRENQSSTAGERITTPLDDDDWVDVEPEEAPPTTKNVGSKDLDRLWLTDGCLLQSPNRHLREWLEKHAESYLPLLFARYTPPPSQSCASCHDACDTFYKCQTCLVSRPSCGRCTTNCHRHSPTHCVERFNGQFWEPASLAELGLILHLGHNGEPCPQQGRVTVSVLVGDLHGFAHVNVGFCDCANHESRSSQLLAAGLMACTDQLPQSAFTLAMLDHLSVFTTAGKCSVFKYWTVLKRLTNTGFPGKVSDRYRELLQTLRKYNYLISRKRRGDAFRPHPLENDPSDEGIPCVACPRPTYNFNESEITDENELEFFRYWASYDGNFRNPRKDKKVDPEDISPTDGNAYFVANEEYKKFLDDLRARGVRPETKSDCSNHKATQNQFVKFLGTDVSGLGAVTCARHSYFMCRAVVDFFKGER